MFHYKEALHQTLAVLTVCFNEFGAAIGNGWVAPVVNTLQKSTGDFSLTMEQCSWIASLAHMGKVFGAFLGAILLDIVGRKFLLSFCATTFFITWLLIITTKSITIIYIIRLLFGIACGINDVTSSFYLGEISSPYIRGVFGTLTSVTYNFGLLLEFIVATYLSYNATAIVNSILEFIAFLSIFGMREPIQYLLMKGKNEQAEKNFLWLKGVHHSDEVKEELEKIKQNTFNEISKKSSYRKILTSPANYKSLFIMSSIYFLVGSTGYYPIMSYASMLFSSTDMLTPNEFTILVGVTQFMAVALSPFVTTRFNRRTILIAAYSLICCTHLSTAILYYIQLHVTEIPYFHWLIFVTITIFCSTYDFAFPTFYLIRGELFPLSVKAVGGCIAVVGYSGMSFLMTKIFLFIFHNYGVYYNFLIFASISAALVTFIYHVLPETRNKSLIEIQEALEKED